VKRLLFLGVAAVALAGAATAQAAGLNLTGETGLGRTPLAATLAPLSLAVAADYVDAQDTFVPVRVAFGVLEGLEVGGSYWYLDTGDNLSVWGLNAKFVIPAEILADLAIAAGYNYQSFSADNGFAASVVKVYGVVSYTYAAGVTLIPSAGVSYEVQGGEWDEFGARFFASLVAKLTPRLALGAEFSVGNEDLVGEGTDPDVWAGARFWPTERLAIQAGVMNNADIGGGGDPDYVFHAGAQYSFSFAR